MAVRCWVLIVGLLKAVCIFAELYSSTQTKKPNEIGFMIMAILQSGKRRLTTSKGVCVHIILLLIRKDDLITHHSKIWALIHVHYSILGFCSVCFRMSI